MPPIGGLSNIFLAMGTVNTIALLTPLHYEVNIICKTEIILRLQTFSHQIADRLGEEISFPEPALPLSCGTGNERDSLARGG